MQTLAGIVSYEPDDRLVDLTRSLVAADLDVVVVDNASRGGDEVLASAERAGARVVRLERNSGVAGGLAALLREAGAHDWLLTLDQDSRATPEMVRRLVAAAATAGPDVAVVAPLVRDAATGAVQQGSPGGAAHPVDRVLTSGALCRVAALERVGGFWEELFIDYVDFDLSHRLRRSGWTLLVDPAAELEHSIGSPRVHRVGPLSVRTSNHSADRVYYRYRNFVLVARSGVARDDARWALRSLLALAWTPLRIAAFENDRRAKLRAVVAGVRDGLRGRGGPRR